MTDIELRLSAQEESVQKITQRVNDLSQSTAERFSIRDEKANVIAEISKSVSSQNEMLQKQLTARWGYITGMMPVLGFFFALNFVYELYKVKEISDKVKEISETKATMDKSVAAIQVANKKFTDDFSKSAKDYSKIIGDLANADSLISDANRRLFRDKDYPATKVAATLAVEKLEKTLDDRFLETRIQVASA
jgi:Fe2+ transport system protein B